jgi:hypothetical protein
MRKRHVAGLAFAALVLAGCGGGSGSAGSDPTSGPPSSAGTASGDPSGDPSGDASSQAPTGPMADGKRVDLGGFTYSAPKGWKVSTKEIFGNTLTFVSAPDYSAYFNSGFLPNTRQQPLDALARAHLRNTLMRPPIKRMPNIEIDGVPAYHWHAQDSGDIHEEYGVWHNGGWMVMEFDFRVGEAKNRQQTIDSVLNTVAWQE